MGKYRGKVAMATLLTVFHLVCISLTSVSVTVKLKLLIFQVKVDWDIDDEAKLQIKLCHDQIHSKLLCHIYHVCGNQSALDIKEFMVWTWTRDERESM
jgi:hypothetical protein